MSTPGSLPFVHPPKLARPVSAPAAGVGNVQDTLVLLNDSLISGNFWPVNGAGPWGLALDPNNGLVYVADDNVQDVSVYNSATGQFVAYIPVGTYPMYVVFDAANGDLYVSNYGSNNVSVINGATNAVLTSIPVGTYPTGMAFDTANGDLYVGNAGSLNLSVIDPTTNKVVANPALTIQPWDLAFDAANQRFYITDYYRGSDLQVLDPATATIVTTYTIGSFPLGVVVDPSNGDVYVANAFSGNVTVLNATTGAFAPSITMPTGFYEPGGLALDAATKSLYVTNLYVSGLVHVSTATNLVTGQVNTGNGAIDAVIDLASGEVLVSNFYSDNVSTVRMSPFATTGSVQLGAAPEGIAFDATNGNLYVVDQALDDVAVVSGTTGKVIATIPVGAYPFGIALDTNNGFLYVANEDSGNVSVLDASTNRPVTSISIPFGCPEAVSFDSGNGAVYVSDDCDSGVDVLDPTTESYITTISLVGSPSGASAWPQGIAYDSVNGDLYVATPILTFFGSQYENLTVISGVTNSVVGNIPVGSQPMGVVFDAATGDVYVACEYSGNITVVDPTLGRSTGSVGLSGSYPFGLTENATSGLLYVADLGSAEVEVVDTASSGVVGSIGVGEEPTWDLWDPSNGRTYVSNWDSGSVSLLATPPATPVLSSVRATPTSLTLPTGTSGSIASAITCWGGACPTGTTYSWTQTHALGTFNTTLGPDVTFTAGAVTAEDALFVNATLNGVTVQSNPVVVTITGPILSVVAISPSPASVPTGGTVSLSASPTCSGGSCPTGTSYTWTLTNALGMLSGASGNTVTFTAGTQAGTDTLFVNGTLNGVRVRGGPDLITLSAGATLAGVAVSPIAPSVPLGGAVFLSASPSCTGAPCPTTITYAWSLTNTLGQLSSAIGSGTTFQAGNLAGQATVFLNASLNGTTRESSALVTILTPSVSLLSVAITPSSTSIDQGGTQTFTATPTCSGSCPSAVSFAWTLNSAFGSLNRTSGTQVNFAAPSSAGDNLLFVVASLNGVEHTAWANITIGSGGGTPTILGVAAPLAYGLIVVIVLLLGILVLMIVVGRRRRKLSSTSPTSATTGTSPPPPPPPPPEPPADDIPPPPPPETSAVEEEEKATPPETDATPTPPSEEQDGETAQQGPAEPSPTAGVEVEEPAGREDSEEGPAPDVEVQDEPTGDGGTPPDDPSPPPSE